MFESRATWLPSYAKYRELEQRAVGSGSNVFVAPEQATIWFDRLRAASVFLQARPIVVGSATAQMLAENSAITPSDPTQTPAVALLPRKATLSNLVSNEALNDSTPALQEVLATEFSRTMASLLDVQYLTGNSAEPAWVAELHRLNGGHERRQWSAAVRPTSISWPARLGSCKR